MKALLIIDAQYDFMPGGKLAVTNGDKIIPTINKLIPNYDLVIFTQDWHPYDMKAFSCNHVDKKPFDNYINDQGENDTLWPEHCVQFTRGAQIHEDIRLQDIKNEIYIFNGGALW